MLELKQEENTLTVFLSGELDHHHAKEIREEVDFAVREQRPPTVVLDFRRVTFMDSSGIGLIMGRSHLMEEYGAKYCQYEREFNLQNEEDYLAEMEANGLQVYYPTDEQKQHFVDATAGVEAAIREQVGDEWVDSFKAAVEEVKAAQ